MLTGLSALPKVELHCHVDGLVNPQLVRTLEAVCPVRDLNHWIRGYGRLV